MQLALISDIHGNLPAMEAVLAAIAARHIEDIICLGDVAAGGPQPREVIARLRALGCPVVMGNTDDWLLDPQRKEPTNLFQQRNQDIDLWCAGQLSASDQDYLRSFQPTIDYPLANSQSFLGYHGSPRSYREPIWPTTPDDVVEDALEDRYAPVMAGGHTHVQMFRRYRDAILLNPGSVGMPMDRVSPLDEVRNPAWAEYAIITFIDESFAVELRRVPFDVEALTHAILTSDMPHGKWSAGEWLTS